MAAQKPSIPKGTRDFGVTEMIRRNYIFDTIRSAFQLYGFKPIETPAMENLSTLLGKYGEEGDKLIYTITNTQTQNNIFNLIQRLYQDKDNTINKSEQQTEGNNRLFNQEASYEFEKLLSDSFSRGLRYDLTVPFARFVVMHQNEITFPFKRYQIQPVWRADRPQKGRYREFYQCDVDVIGSDSLLNERELIQLTNYIFLEFNLSVNIKINNRKILFGIAESLGVSDKFIDFTIVLDKLDKMKIEDTSQELINKGFNDKQIEHIINTVKVLPKFIHNSEKLKYIKELCKTSEIGMKGIIEIESILECPYTNSSNNIVFDFTLARGLNYYTGAIFEVVINPSVYKDIKMGSIAGGGRYDDLTGIFGLPNVSGVGISFGADRIYDVLNELNLFPENTGSTTQLLFVNFGEAEEKYCLPIVAEARKHGINTELYPSSAKLKKQFDYANSNNIPFVAVAGNDEVAENSIMLKDMRTGTQEKIYLKEFISKLLLVV